MFGWGLGIPDTGSGLSKDEHLFQVDLLLRKSLDCMLLKVALSCRGLLRGAEMKVFISWSGEVSRSIASKLYDWLPMVLQSVQPYMSSESIDKGTRWASSIANELDGTATGIVVLTSDNLLSPWIYFESGALAKAVGDSKLAPLLFGLKPSDIGTPLSQFQVTIFNKDDMLKLLISINSCSDGDPLPDGRLEKMHNALWNELHQEIDPIIASAATKQPASPKKSDDETLRILEEILVLSRQQSQALLSPEKMISGELVRLIADVVTDSSLSVPEFENIRHIARHFVIKWDELSQVLAASQGAEDAAWREKVSSMSQHLDVVGRDLMGVVEAGRRRNGPARMRNLAFHSNFKASENPK